jgi:hypothetical protein
MTCAWRNERNVRLFIILLETGIGYFPMARLKPCSWTSLVEEWEQAKAERLGYYGKPG